MPNTNLDETVQILNLVLGVEPVVLSFIKSILTRSQGQTGDQFLAEADAHWDAVIAAAKKELGQ